MNQQPQVPGLDAWLNRLFKDIEEIRTTLSRIDERLRVLEADTVRLKVLSALWGSIGGAALALITSLVLKFIERH
ncbi:MAG: hypothetical protein U0Z53_23645 [Blastocatellia bacterium]